MVYIALEELGWRPYIKTWTAQGLKTALPEASEQLRDQIYALFDTYVDAGLNWVNRNGKQYIVAVENNLTSSLAWLVQSLMMPSRGFKYGAGVRPEDQTAALGKIFAFAFVWSLGGNLAHGVKEEFDDFAREHLQPLSNFPGGGLVFDYMVDGSKVSTKCGGRLSPGTNVLYFFVSF